MPWAAPVVVFAAYVVEPGLWWDIVDLVIPAMVAIGVVGVASRRPDLCLVALLAFMPAQVFVPAWLYSLGVPESIVRPMSGWQELLAGAIALAAIRHARREHHRFDHVDWLATAYVVVVGAYALFPGLFAADAPTDGEIRSLAFRSSAGFVAVLLACRHAGFTEAQRVRFSRALRAAAVVVSLLAVWEFVDGDAWNRWAVDTVGVTRYQIEVLDAAPFDPTDIRVRVDLAGREFVRVSSLLLSPLALGHYLLMPFALSLERALRGRTAVASAQAGVIAAALLLTQTRSAMLGALVIAVIALRRVPGRATATRSRFVLVLVGACIAATPFILSAGLLDRFSDEGSNDIHESSFFEGVEQIASEPLGAGLGTSAGVGQRFGTVTGISENYYLQVGTETGILGLVLFVAVVVTGSRALRRSRDATGDELAAGARSGFVALVLAAFFLHELTNRAVAWSAFGVAGAALGAAPAARTRGGGDGTMDGNESDRRPTGDPHGVA